MGIFSKTKAKLEADAAKVEAEVVKVETLIYTPVAGHPLLEEIREQGVALIQSHMTMLNGVLQKVEAALTANGLATVAGALGAVAAKATAAPPAPVVPAATPAK